MVERVSRHWWLVFGVTKVSSRTSAASLNPASISPTYHSSVSLPIGKRPALASSKSALVHLTVRSSGGVTGGLSPGFAGGGGTRTQAFPSVLAFGLPGRRLASGSVTKGRGSRSILIF